MIINHLNLSFVHQEEYRKAIEKQQRLTGTAGKLGERIQSSLTEDELTKKLKILQRKVNNIDVKESVDELRNIIEAKKKDFEHSEVLIEALKCTISMV